MSRIDSVQVSRLLRRAPGPSELVAFLERSSESSFSADGLDEAVRTYVALGNELSPEQSKLLHHVQKTLASRPVFVTDEGEEDSQIESLRETVGVGPKPLEAWEAALDASSAGAPVLSPRGDALCVITSKGTLHVFDLKGELLWKLTLGSSELAQAVWSPDGRTLAVSGGSKQTELHVVDVGEQRILWSRVVAQARNLRVQAAPPVFSLDGKSLFLGAVDDSVKAFDVASGEEKWGRGPYLPGAESRHSSPTLSADGSTIFSMGHDGNYYARVLACDVESGAVKWQLDPGGAARGVPLLSRDGATLFVPSSTHVVACDAQSGKIEWRRAVAKEGVQLMLAETPDESHLLLSRDDGVVDILDRKSGEHVKSLQNPDAEKFWSPVAFEPDGGTGYVSSHKGRLSVIDVVGQEIHPLVDEDSPEPMWAWGSTLHPERRVVFQTLTQRGAPFEHLLKAVPLPDAGPRSRD